MPAAAGEPPKRRGEANHIAAPWFWRTLRDDPTVEDAQARLDKWCSTRSNIRLRTTADGRATVQALAEGESLAPMLAPFPAVLSVTRTVSAQAWASFRGNRYSVPPELHGATVSVSVRLDGAHLNIATEPGPGRGLRTADRDRPAALAARRAQK